jgi:hypothetical protein
MIVVAAAVAERDDRGQGRHAEPRSDQPHHRRAALARRVGLSQLV